LLIIVILFIGYVLVKGVILPHIRRTKRKNDDAKRAALETIAYDKPIKYPSWIHKKETTENFVKETKILLLSLGATQEIINNFLSQQEIHNALITMAAELEDRGFSIIEQIVLASELAGELYKKIYSEVSTENLVTNEI
jgi:hypothetical protein